MNKDATGTATDLNTKLGDANAAAVGPRKDELTAAIDARTRTEGEITPNTQAIKDKGTEITVAQGHETRGKGDYDDKTRGVADVQRTLDTQNTITVPFKKDRDDALKTANDNTPLRSQSDEINATRRSRIADTDIPAQNGIRDRAGTAKDEGTAGVGETTKSKDTNNTELAPMPAVRQGRVDLDTALHKRSTDTTKDRDDAQKTRDTIAADIKNKKAVLKDHREHSDDIDNAIQSRKLQDNAGVHPLPTKDVAAQVSSKRQDATTTGTSAAKNHAVSIKEVNGVIRNTSDVNTKIKTTADEQARLGAIRTEMKTGIPRENAIAARMDSGRNAQPGIIRDARAQADVAISHTGKEQTNIDATAQELLMANDAHSYFNDPLEPTQRKIRENKDRAKGAGDSAARQRDTIDAAERMRSKSRDEQANADNGRKQSANETTLQKKAEEDANDRKENADTALTDIQQKNKRDMDAMQADTDGSVIRAKKSLDDAGAAAVDQGRKVEAARRTRTEKEADAEVQGRPTAAKGDEVNRAKQNEAAAAAAEGDARADVAKKQQELNDLVAAEPKLLADRTKAHDGAEGFRPVRDANDAVLGARKNVIEGAELPEARKNRDTIEAEHERAGGPIRAIRDKRTANNTELENIRLNRQNLTMNNTNLQATQKAAVNKRNGFLDSYDTADTTITKGNETLQKYSQYMDAVDNVIFVKKSGGQKESVAQVKTYIDADQSKSSSAMRSGSRQHAISEGSLNRSTADINGANTSIGDNTRAGDALKNARKEIGDGIIAEKANRNKHIADMTNTVQLRDGLKKKADEAAGNARKAEFDGNDLKGRPDGMDDLTYYRDQAQADLDAEVKRGAGANAAAAGETAARANTGRNRSNADAENAKADRLAHDSNRTTENGNAAKHKADADDARARKIVEDNNLENIKKKNKNDMDKMDSDAAGAVSGRKRDLDDATGAAKKQDDSITDASKKRDDMEKAVGENGTAVDSKKKEVSDAQNDELAAKNQMDADAATKKKHQDDLDGLTGQEANLKKGRDDAEANAENARPKRSDEDTAKKDQQSKLDGEAGDLTKVRDDAQGAKDAAIDGAGRTKVKQDGLPDADDTGPLRDKDAELQKKKKDEEDNRDDLEEGSGKHRKKMEGGILRLQAKQQVVGSLSASITDIIRFKFGDKFLPPPPQPLMTGYFKYPPGPSGSVRSTTTSGPKPAGFVDPGTGVATLVSEVDLGGMGDIKYTDPSYERGKIAGAQDGARDATSDAIDVFLNRKDQTIKELESRIGQLEFATKREIDSAVEAQSQDAYCKQIKEEGAAQKLDISTIFSECSAYFQKQNPMASQPVKPMASQPLKPMAPPLEQLGGPIGSESSGANEDSSGANEDSSGANEDSSGAQEGGYMEDLSGVMQFGGKVTNSGPVVPSQENDVEYMNGYRIGYKKAYTRTYSLTMAIKITQKGSKEDSEKGAPKKGENGYGAEIETIIRESMPVTEAAAIKTTKDPKSTGKKGAATAEGPITTEAEATSLSKSSTKATGPVTEAAANATGPLAEAVANATGPVTEAAPADPVNVTGPTQGGGFLQRALHNFQRGRTLRQHERLLKRIVDKTIAV
jgi:hypothetical protein